MIIKTITGIGLITLAIFIGCNKIAPAGIDKDTELTFKIHKWENHEVICYVYDNQQYKAGAGGISCFKKEE